MIFGRTDAERRAAYEQKRDVTGKFALFPRPLHNGQWVWLQRYTWSTTCTYGGCSNDRYPMDKQAR